MPPTFTNLGVESRLEYLRSTAQLPFVQNYVARGIDLLKLGPGQKLADLGCGIAHDVEALSRPLGPGGSIVFVDQDQSVLQVASRSVIGLSRDVSLSFLAADIHKLPFENMSFDATRIVRTLMHSTEPQKAVNQMVRITKPGGLVLAIEPVWNTWSESGKPEISTAIKEEICRGLNYPDAGAMVPVLFTRAGLKVISTEHKRMSFADPATAEKVFLINHKIENALKNGQLPAAATESRKKDIAALRESSAYECGVDVVLCLGMR